MLPLIKQVFEEWCLYVNEEKTEFVHMYLANKSELDEQGKSKAHNEDWRKNKLLGSRLCSIEDLEQRMILASISFNNTWLKNSKISLERKTTVDEAQVISILLYNCSSWALSKLHLHKLDVYHRRHLRTIVKMKWPIVVSNEDLYKRCKTTPLSTRVKQQRWRMLGHILRMDDNVPAVSALTFALTTVTKMPGRIGRPQTNLLTVLKQDLKSLGIPLNDYCDMNELRTLLH